MGHSKGLMRADLMSIDLVEGAMFDAHDYAVEVTDDETISFIESVFQAYVEPEKWLLSTDRIRQNNWASVPLPDGVIGRQREEWILGAIWNLGYHECYAVPRFSAGSRQYYRVSISGDGLSALQEVTSTARLKLPAGLRK